MQPTDVVIGSAHALESGAGPTLLCLHGVGSSARSFLPQLDGLSDRYRVVAWDAPGFGGSENPSEAIDMGGYAEAAALAGWAGSRSGGDPRRLVGWCHRNTRRARAPRPGRGVDPHRVVRRRGSGSAAAEKMRRRAEDLETDGVEETARSRVARLLSPSAPADLVERVRAQMIADVRAEGFVPATTRWRDRPYG